MRFDSTFIASHGKRHSIPAKFIARQYANGWQIEIVPLRHGHRDQTKTFSELADAINEAKKIVDASRKTSR
jgi:predicted class III extradiol MEMO1 family dioxygenase